MARGIVGQCLLWDSAPSSGLDVAEGGARYAELAAATAHSFEGCIVVTCAVEIGATGVIRRVRAIGAFLPGHAWRFE